MVNSVLYLYVAIDTFFKGNQINFSNSYCTLSYQMIEHY